MKKELVFLLTISILIVFLLNSVFAANETAVDTAYNCLKSQMGEDCGGTKNIAQLSFNLLAMAYDSNVQADCKSILKSKINGDCWGMIDVSSCNIKSTAIATLALKEVGENVDTQVNWLLSKRQSSTGLTWYLEIDSNNKTECSINGKKIIIGENKKISGSDPAGLIKAYNDNWFEVKDVSKNYTISCDQDFVTTLLYKKPLSTVLFVSNNLHSASAGDTTEEKIEAFCFTTSPVCDYEGSLWATLALAKDGQEISSYIPYLSAMSDETANKNFIPSAFLFMMTGADDYYRQLVDLQIQAKYWDLSRDKLYDTSIAMLALQSTGAQEFEDAKKYLLGIQESSGCWSANTALILYSGWPKTIADTEDKGGKTSVACEDYDYYCVSSLECSSASKMDNFQCFSLDKICCKTAPVEETCSDKGGIVCGDGEECSSSKVTASDTNNCCLASCQEVIVPTNECEDAGAACKLNCLSTEEEKTVYGDSCKIGEKCCGSKPASSGTSWLLIILLIILIILIILAILFRNQLKVWVFKVKSGFKGGKGPTPTNRPASPPPGYRPIPRGLPLRQPISSRIPIGRRIFGRSDRDRDFDDTMKKLRDMSK